MTRDELEMMSWDDLVEHIASQDAGIAGLEETLFHARQAIIKEGLRVIELEKEIAVKDRATKSPRGNGGENE